MTSTFRMPVSVRFGDGCLATLGDCTGGRSVLIVTDATMVSMGALDAVRRALEGRDCTVFAEVEPNPSCDTVNRAASLCRQRSVDTVIGLGGGSPMDAAKAVAAMRFNDNAIEEILHGRAAVPSRRAGLIMVPTTAGTGSEVTSVIVLSDIAANVKKFLVNEVFFADFAVVDPTLTYSMPPAVTAITGLDALAHAFESYWSKNAWPLTESIAIQAAASIMHNLPAAYAEPGNGPARAAMARAALMAGVAFGQTRTTACHAVSYPITNDFHVSHGIACVLTLAAFLDHYYTAAPAKLDALARHCGFATAGLLADAVRTMQKAMGIPVRLGEVGVAEKDLDRIADEALTMAITGMGPAPLDKRTLRGVLEKLL